MKICFKYIIGLSLLLSLARCTNVEEEVFSAVTSDKYPENPDQISGIALKIYTQLPNLLDDYGWWYLTQEVTSDEFVIPTRAGDWGDGGKWTSLHNFSWTNKTVGLAGMWKVLYLGITDCNNTSDILKTYVQSDATRAQLAQVETMRAFYYYLLMDNFGHVPYVTTSNLDVNVLPYRLSSAKICDSLSVSLRKAIPLLSKVDKKGLVSRTMGETLLAKILMNSKTYKQGISTTEYNANLTEAKALCDSVIGSGFYSIDSDPKGPFKTENDLNSEIIFSVDMDDVNAKGFRMHMRSLHYSSSETFEMIDKPWNGGGAEEAFYNSYEATDARKSAYHLVGQQYTAAGAPIKVDNRLLILNPVIKALVLKATDTYAQIKFSAARLGKWEIKKGCRENLSNNFVFFRISDVYLMRGECDIRLGGNGDADINLVRTTRGGAALAPFVNCTLDQLLAERGRELYSEGHRRQDQIRFDAWTKAWWEKPAITETPDGTPVYIFPVPEEQSASNQNLLLPPL